MITKKKKMTIIISISVYLLVSLIVYLLTGGFYFTIKYGQSNLRVGNMSVNQLDSSKDKIIKGVYAGIVDYKDQKNDLFQFNGMFKDEARILNVYFPVDKGDASFLETDEKISGTDAFFLLQVGTFMSGYYENEHPKGIVFNDYYRDSKLPNPETFLKKTGANASIGDSLFVLSLHVNTDWLNIQMLNFVKNNYGFYGLIRKEAELIENDWQLKDTSVNKGQMYKGIFNNILLAIIDVITAGVQVFVAVLYGIYMVFDFIFTLIKTGPLK